MLYAVTCNDCYGSIEIDGVNLSTLAWCTPDLSSLWGTPEIRGEDRPLPGTVGVIAYRRRATVTRYSLPFFVSGQCDENGAPYADPNIGLETNMAWLFTNVFLPTNVGDGTRELIWHLPSGAEVTADVHVLGFRPGLTVGALARGTLELSCPGGNLHLQVVGS